MGVEGYDEIRKLQLTDNRYRNTSKFHKFFSQFVEVVN